VNRKDERPGRIFNRSIYVGLRRFGLIPRFSFGWTLVKDMQSMSERETTTSRLLNEERRSFSFSFS